MRRPEFFHRPEVRAVVQLVRRNWMVLPVAREEDDGHLAAFSQPWGIAGRAVRRDEELSLFVLAFERIPECGTSEHPNAGRSRRKRTRRHGAVKLPAPTD